MMKLSNKQGGVLKGMSAAMLTVIISIAMALVFNPLNITSVGPLERITVLGYSLILPTFFVMMSIGRLAKFRFFSPEDIDGSGLTSATNEATILQSILQNTLEQVVIVYGVYSAWCLLMPATWLSVAPICSLLFAIGRICFIKGYHRGAPARAFGFALTFYSTVIMFVLLVAYLLSSVI